jgi:hypothetical protein
MPPLVVLGFLSVASAASLQFVGARSQAEAFRNHASRLSVGELQHLMIRLETVPTSEKAGVAREIGRRAESLRGSGVSEGLTAASRRVSTLASWEVSAASEDLAVRQRLRAELAGIIVKTEQLEAAALTQTAELHFWTNLALWSAVLLFGLCAMPMRVERVRKP